MTATTWNPADCSAAIALSNGNLTAINLINSGNSGVRANFSSATGKFYYEAFITANDQNYYNTTGISKLSAALNSIYAGTNGAGVGAGGEIVVNGVNILALGATTIGQTLCIAVNLDAKLFWARINGGIWNGSALADPASLVGGVDISGAGSIGGLAAAPSMASVSSIAGNQNVTANFGGTPFSFAQPSGFGVWNAVQPSSGGKAGSYWELLGP